MYFARFKYILYIIPLLIILSNCSAFNTLHTPSNGGSFDPNNTTQEKFAVCRNKAVFCSSLWAEFVETTVVMGTVEGSTYNGVFQYTEWDGWSHMQAIAKIGDEWEWLEMDDDKGCKRGRQEYLFKKDTIQEFSSYDALGYIGAIWFPRVFMKREDNSGASK